MKLPDALHSFIDRYYAAESPYRIWAYMLTFCVILWFPRNTRRIGAIGFAVIVLVMIVTLWLGDVFKSFSPDRH